MATKAEILDAVGQLCRTDTPAHIGPAIDGYLAGALRRYSRDRPFEDVEDITGEAAKLLTVPTNWTASSSVIRKIVYPYTDEDSTVLEGDDYAIDTIPVGGSPVQKIRFRSYEPATTETVRCWFTRPHVVTDAVCTVYAEDVSALAHLVAYVIEGAKASHFLGLRDQGQETDLVDYGTKAGIARGLAKDHLAFYRQGLGLPVKEGASVAVAVAGDIDLPPDNFGVSHLRHHRRRWR